ncbi:MAG: pilus assembly protein TadG-related protein, partial [Alphaproteobacteria bacterium]|nr:pilus assembly protein TadG-related protein [Alphaproteobacteria bacterium]
NLRDFVSLFPDKRGMTTLIVALVLMPLVAAMAVALDLARVSHSKGQLQQAVDTAVISAARTYVTKKVENGGNPPDAYDQALSSGQNIFRSNYPDATLTLNFNVSGGFNGTAQVAVGGTLAAAMGLADVNPVAKACALTPASGYTSLTPCVADAPPPCRPGAFPELSCNQSACPAGMYDQTYQYQVSGTVTEPSCGSSRFTTKSCSLSCPEAPKPVGCGAWRMALTYVGGKSIAKSHNLPLCGAEELPFHNGLRPLFQPGMTTRYIDSRCRILTEADALSRGRICEGSMVIARSPISLIWDEGFNIDDSFTLSTFPLDPFAPAGLTYEWRASSKAPLLVWDEKGDGVITTAAQLFGNYTFGKRWPEGYTALHSLDSDKNGNVSGDELKHIRIWFDDNANGVSEPGEVKDLAAVGVTTLYTVPDRKDIKTGFIHAKRGYDRVVDGKTVTLPSVDWAAKAYKTPSEASSGAKAPAAPAPAGDSGGATPASSSAPSGAATGSSSGKSSGASGSGSGGSAGGASGSGAGGGASGGGSGGGGGGSGGGAAPTTSSKSALGGSSTAKTVAMDIAGIWQIAYAPIDGADDPLGISGISFVPGAYWNELSGFVFNPYDPLYGDTEEFETQRAIYEKQFPNLPLQPNTPEGLSTLRDIFLKGLNAVKPGTNPDASKWGSKSSLVGSYSGKETYIFSEIDPLTEQQTLYTLTFTDGTGTFKGTMTAQIPGRGQLKRDFTGKRLQVYKQ